MKHKFSIKGFLVNLLIAGFIAGIGASQGSPVSATIVAIVLMGLAMAKPWLPMIAMSLFGTSTGFAHGGAQKMDIQAEIWETHIEGNMFLDNEFILESMDDSEWVNFKTIHLPQAGSTPNVVKNRSLPAGPVDTTSRVDVVVTYDIDDYTTDPIRLTLAEMVELSYSKRENVLYEHELTLSDSIANNIIISWAPTGTATLPANLGGGVNNNILRSSGITNNDIADVQSSVAYLPGAIGNRLNFTLWDIRQAKKFLGKQRVPKVDRHMLISEDAQDQLISDLIATKFRQDALNVFDTKEGTITRLLGFTVHVRASVCTYDNSLVPVVKAVDAATSTTDNDAIILWQKAAVRKSKGDVIVRSDMGSPTYYGDVFSIEARAGGVKSKISEIGVCAIVQAAA